MRSHRKIFVFTILLAGISISVLAQPMYIGSDYYPNTSPKAQIEKDAELMKQAGFNVARLGDLVWDLMEPQEGLYDFSWVHSAVDILSKAGIKTFLATPTAAIPKWMYDKHPEIMQLSASGERKPYGKRRHACLNNPVYRDYCLKIATALAAEFKANSHVIACQVDNELMAEEPYCYCSFCQKKFSQWLAAKYKTVDNLNKAWNLAFWSQNVRSFDEVYLPRKGDNPSCFQNYQEFNSDCAIDFYNLQRNAIMIVDPAIKVSHNICSSGFLYLLDLYKMSRTCDFMSIDNYPYGWTLENEYGNKGPFTFTPHMVSLALSQLRGAKQQAPFWVTEAQIGRTAGNQRKIIEPGMVRLWSIQEMAQGAMGIKFFPFKTFPAGHEHVMVGVLDEDNVPRRRFMEAQQIATEAQQIKQLTGQTLPVAQAAIIRDFKCDWAFEDGRFAMDFRYMRHVFEYYRALRNASVTTDIISSEDNFANYKLIVIPSLVLLNESVCERLKTAARNGCTLIITCMTGLRNDDIKSFGRIMNHSIEELAGIQMEEQHALIGLESARLKFANDSSTYSCSLWYDVFSLTTASPLAYYDSRFMKGKCVVAKNTYGKGNVIYIGSVVEDKVSSILLREALKTAKIEPLAISDNELMEVTEVVSSSGKYVYAINFSNESKTIHLLQPMVDILTNEKLKSKINIDPMDFKVLKIQ
ncbi:MAG: beta-galactosidase [Bacteroidia bacterium]